MCIYCPAEIESQCPLNPDNDPPKEIYWIVAIAIVAYYIIKNTLKDFHLM